MAPQPEPAQTIVFVPTLGSLLVRAENLKGAPLTEPEVLGIRDNAICMTVSPEQARAIAESRGYEDLDPEHVWAEWQQLRAELGRAG